MRVNRQIDSPTLLKRKIKGWIAVAVVDGVVIVQLLADDDHTAREPIGGDVAATGHTDDLAGAGGDFQEEFPAASFDGFTHIGQKDIIPIHESLILVEVIAAGALVLVGDGADEAGAADDGLPCETPFFDLLVTGGIRRGIEPAGEDGEGVADGGGQIFRQEIGGVVARAEGDAQRGGELFGRDEAEEAGGTAFATGTVKTGDGEQAAIGEGTVHLRRTGGDAVLVEPAQEIGSGEGGFGEAETDGGFVEANVRSHAGADGGDSGTEGKTVAGIILVGVIEIA